MRRIISAFAILWLIVAGILVLAAGALFTQSMVTGTRHCYGGFWCDLTPFFIGFGVVAMVIGAGHVVAAVGVWRQRTWGERLGRMLAFGGLLFSLVFLSEGIHVWWVLPTIGYGVTLVVLFKRSPGAPGRLAAWIAPTTMRESPPEPHDPPW